MLLGGGGGGGVGGGGGGRFRRGSWGSIEPPLTKNLNFHGNFWIKLINFGYRIYFKYSHPLLVEVHFTTCEYL